MRSRVQGKRFKLEAYSSRQIVVRLTLSRSEIALLVCSKSASAAVVIAASLSATRSVGDVDLRMMVEELVN